MRALLQNILHDIISMLTLAKHFAMNHYLIKNIQYL